MKADADSFFPTQPNASIRFTPRELIRYHMEHPDIPITDEHIENLVLDFSNSQQNATDPIEQNSNNLNHLNSNPNFTSVML